MPSLRPAVVYLLFFISGFTALVFEVVWAKQAALLLGNTTFASAAVIAAFMTGLALGSFRFGRVADARPEDSLRLYGILEGGIGLFALLFPVVTFLLIPFYGALYAGLHQHFWWLSAGRFLIAFALVIVPTTLMGGTLPLLTRHLRAQARSFGEEVSGLYAVNLFGAMAGAFASGFYLIHRFGIRGATLLAAFVNLAIAGFILTRPRVPVAPRAAVPSPEPSGGIVDRATLGVILGLMVVHGFGAFVVQICWTRTLALILGSSTYAFSAVLTVFLAGLGLGSFAVGRIVRKKESVSLAFAGLSEMGFGAGILLFIPVFEWLVYYFVRVYPLIVDSVALVFFVQFSFAAAAMIVPAFLMGLVFPASLAALGDPRQVGRAVGITYAANTAGGVLGASLAAFALIPAIGLNGSLRAMGFLSLAAGSAVLAFAFARTRDRAPLWKGAAAVFVSTLFFFYPWDKNLFSSGVFMYANTMKTEASLGKRVFQKALGKRSEILYYKDGVSSTVTVHRYGASRSLRVNGKVDASTTGDMETQILVGYIPLFAHPRPESALVIGLGSGITLSAAADIGTLTEIDCVEIEPAVVEASRYFAVENNNVLSDPRVRLIVGDGRNHVRFSPKQYDVIISEPSNPWMSGVSSLFSKENYEASLKRLKPGGVYGQWLHAYQMSIEDFVMIMKTFASVFPQVNLYKISLGDYLLVGSLEPVRFDPERIFSAAESSKSIRKRLGVYSRHGKNFPVGAFLFSDRDLRAALETWSGPVNTDDRLSLEYSAPKHLYIYRGDEILFWLYWNRHEDLFPGLVEGGLERLREEPDFWKIYRSNAKDAVKAGYYPAAVRHLEDALRLKPGDPELRFEAARAYEGDGQFEKARGFYAGLSEDPIYGRRSAVSVSKAVLKQKMKDDPKAAKDPRELNRLGRLAFLAGDTLEEVQRILERAIFEEPLNGRHYTDLAYYSFLRGSPHLGVTVLKKAIAYSKANDPALQRVLTLWRSIRTVEGRRREAIRKKAFEGNG